jgi:hypothetical protein
VIGGNTIIGGTTECRGPLQLFNTVNASDGKVLIDPGNLTCAFSTVQSTAGQPGLGQSATTNFILNADNVTEDVFALNYEYSLITKNYYSHRFATGHNFNDTFYIGADPSGNPTTTYSLQPITILDISGDEKTILTYVLISN